MQFGKGQAVCETVFGDTIKRRLLYAGPGFPSSAAWPLMPKKHNNGLINQLQTSNIMLVHIEERVKTGASQKENSK